MGKYVWWITNKADILWVRWVHAVYIKQKSWMDLEPSITSSWSWRKICQVKNILKDIIFDSRGSPVVAPYSSRKGYSLLVPDVKQVRWFPWMLTRCIIPKHDFFIWLITHKRLLAQDCLVNMHITQQNSCYLYGAMAEDHNHLFFKCDYSQRCLVLVFDGCKTSLLVHGWMEWWLNWRQRSTSRKQVIALILTCLSYHIWHMRNNCRLEGVVIRPEILVKVIKQEVCMRLDQYVFKCKNGNVLKWIEAVRSSKG
ncbi:uncharacterized protein LOC141652283 [Silene latifolia]|uniref:uncharacterized protein LOC141652283 n=1 Tax=Silene latifolia TaxID=37657 RepID=UPI003D76E933